MTNNDVYARVFGEIVEEMKKGNLPWARPWKGSGFPVNAVTKRAYSGGNVVALWFKAMAKGWTDLGFVTFKQAQAAGCMVRKGEKGTYVYFMSRAEKKDSKGKEEKEFYFFAKSFVVFNVEQLEEVEEGALAKLKGAEDTRTELERNAEADCMVSATGASICHTDDMRAYYDHSSDYINMPRVTAFTSTSGYYGTLFHELTHWTGTERRCNRNLSGKYGNPDYAFEELVAEIGAAFLSARFGMESVTQSAAYLQSWAKACEAHPEMLARAASMAQTAADFVTGEKVAPVAAAA
jgi:antirestriction protein ArdC